MLENYRATTAVDEIISIIEKSHRGEETFMWLTLNKQRVKYKIGNLNVDPDYFQLSFNIEKSAKEHLRPHKSYYLKLDYDSSAFKVFVVSINNDLITCSLPDKVLSIEKRRQKRISCKPTQENVVTVKIESEVMKNSFQDFRFRIMDFSKWGFAMILTKEQMKNFSKSEGKVLLSSLKDEKLQTPIDLDVLYFKQMVSKKGPTTKVLFRIGLKFKNAIPSELLLKFKSTFL